MTSHPKAVFLHTGYRTAGTWLWSCFRSLDEVVAFYEPLHEMLATIDPKTLASSTANSWRSGHPDLDAPYFAEFAELLLPNVAGVPGYDTRFAIDTFEEKPATSPEILEALAAYISGLICVANEQGGVPVFKFCRSLGRLPWFRSTFPDAVHIAVGKNPISQWQSCWQLFARHRNAHFVADSFAVLSLTKREPVARFVIDALKVELPQLPTGSEAASLTRRLDFFKRHVTRISPASCYRAFLAHWLLEARHAATHAHALFDCDLAARSPAYTQAAEQWIAGLSGLQPSFADIRRDDRSGRGCGLEVHEGVQIHIEAMQLAEQLVSSGEAHADSLTLWRSKLAEATQALAEPRGLLSWRLTQRARRLFRFAANSGKVVTSERADDATHRW
jgi:hypothetical protein